MFSGKLFFLPSFLLIAWSIIIFSILTSSVYFMNDIIDISRDKLHPFKKFRPIASGKLPVPLALFFASFGVLVSLYLSFNISFFFFLICLIYFCLQVVYSLYLKNLIVLDVLSIAASFILRIYGGAIVLNYHISIWFLLCVTSLALFMAVGKRRAELSLLDKETALSHRKTLSHYTADLLDDYLAMFSASAWMSWALFTFFESSPVVLGSPVLYSILPLTISGTNKLLMITIPVVIYGIMRYLSIVYQGSRAESPERILLSDKPLLGSVILWGLLVIWILYGAGS
ncbi:decaprenyl-phosphate phosphoribosyltransferase [Candidatus Shapirobacteria bacterium CG07_land_8_20_14_0_80_39_18]|uniref:Decaprenyl-phosphate phosphoribosyltransferase n=1 Tax=Candidatus Shapirobacteria bacterium CG07_land_8_20_14_0_80_39_18 TaxID=1974882 RepID=A0A2M6YRR0_9BACT|nr:MAG: decaprenyl-phosphate phosphoribosyltransferase [Candidatus Shapirobacteria bacterium CG07_land_8_20_14_0_80_39_18]